MSETLKISEPSFVQRALECKSKPADFVSAWILKVVRKACLLPVVTDCVFAVAACFLHLI